MGTGASVFANATLLVVTPPPVLVVISSLLLIGLPSFLFSPPFDDDDVEGVGAVESITTFFSSPTNVGSFVTFVVVVVATLEDFVVLLTVLP